MIDWINQIFDQDIFVRSSIHPSCFLVPERQGIEETSQERKLTGSANNRSARMVSWTSCCLNRKTKTKNLYRKLNGVINNGPVEMIS